MYGVLFEIVPEADTCSVAPAPHNGLLTMLTTLLTGVRRSNVLVSFIGGALLFHEGNIRQKIVPFIGIITGLILIMLKL